MVASRSDGTLSATDDATIAQVEEVIRGLAGVVTVIDQGVSSDGQARKALVVTTSNGGNTGNPDLVKAIRTSFVAAQPPLGLSFRSDRTAGAGHRCGASASQTGTNIRVFIVLFVIVLLFVVYRSVLAPLVTLLPAVLSLVLAGPLIAVAGQGGLPVSVATQTLLPVLLLGAGTDYGLFLVYRVREEIRRGSAPRDALVIAMGRVGRSIAYSAVTVMAALACLLLASFSLYRGLGPSLALGVAVMLAAALTLLPALLAIFGTVLFWPSHPTAGQQTTGAWGRVATRVVQRPLMVLIAGVILFGTLAAGLLGFVTGGFLSGAAPAGTDSATGTAAIAAHFPIANSNPETFLLRFATPIWEHPESSLWRKRNWAAHRICVLCLDRSTPTARAFRWTSWPACMHSWARRLRYRRRRLPPHQCRQTSIRPTARPPSSSAPTDGPFSFTLSPRQVRPAPKRR